MEIDTNIKQKEEIAEIKKIDKVNQSETNSFKSVNIVINLIKNNNAFCDLMNLVNQINNTTPDFKIQIRLTTDPITQTELLEIGHTAYETETLCELYPELLEYFYSHKGNILGKGEGYSSKKGLVNNRYLNEMEGLKTLKECYSSLPHLTVPLPELPQFSSFSGDDKQIGQIFTSLLSCSEGLVIGEYTHGDKMPKTVLIQQMEHLHSLGVRTLFLEHCCFDTLQPKLDEFFQTKQPSAFLSKFLKKRIWTLDWK